MNVYKAGTRKHALQEGINKRLDRIGEIADFLQELGLYREDEVTGEILLEDLRTECPRYADELHNLQEANKLAYKDLCEWGWS